MSLVLVALLSVLVGLAVYVGTVRGRSSSSGTGFGDDEASEAAETMEPGVPPPGYAYLQVSTQRPALRDRLLGLFGVILLIGFSAASLAFVLYGLGHLINRTIEAFLDT